MINLDNAHSSVYLPFPFCLERGILYNLDSLLRRQHAPIRILDDLLEAYELGAIKSRHVVSALYPCRSLLLLFLLLRSMLFSSSDGSHYLHLLKVYVAELILCYFCIKVFVDGPKQIDTVSIVDSQRVLQWLGSAR